MMNGKAFGWVSACLEDTDFFSGPSERLEFGNCRLNAHLGKKLVTRTTGCVEFFS